MAVNKYQVIELMQQAGYEFYPNTSLYLNDAGDEKTPEQALEWLNKPQTKHTPGPWDIDGLGSEDYQIYVPSQEPIQLIGKVYGCSQVRANANLIAAAPELLEAIKDIEALLTFEVVMDKPDLVESCLKLCKVIAKAEGRA